MCGEPPSNSECDCWNHDSYDLCPIYDIDGTEGLSEVEFEAMKVAVENGTVPWTDDEIPIPDPDPTPTPDPDPTPTPDPSPVPTPDETDGGNGIQSQSEFDYWTQHQNVGESNYFCHFDIRNTWHNGYILWAGHDCEIYDLKLKVHVPKEAWETRRTWTSSDMECLSEECDDTECVATFFMHPNNSKLALGFDAEGEPIDFKFETESWTECIEGMDDGTETS